MLKIVRYSGYALLDLTVHCVQTPATAIRAAARGPSSRSAIRFAAYNTDSVEPLASGIGRLTFQSEVRQDVTSRTRRGTDAES